MDDSGSVSGNSIHLNDTYTLGATCTMTMDGTVSPTGTMSGTWTDNCSGTRTGTWSTTSGNATLIAVTTNPATAITTSNATLNATNGGADATYNSFWVSTSTFSTATPNIPANVYSTPVLGPTAANTSFSDPLSLVTTNGITTGGVPGNMPAITPNTTYYFVAWSYVNGTWYPGTILNFTTASVASSTPTNKDQCMNNGWMTFTKPTFKNQGQCVSYVQANPKAGKQN